jgi:hypothetical protein
MDRKAAIQDYFRAFRERDRAALERLLLPDFRHSSPFGLHEDRDRMLDMIWPEVGRHWAEDVEIYGDGPDYMVRYRHSTGALMAEHFRFDGDRIAAVEVYVGKGPAPGGSEHEKSEI